MIIWVQINYPSSCKYLNIEGQNKHRSNLNYTYNYQNLFRQQTCCLIHAFPRLSFFFQSINTRMANLYLYLPYWLHTIFNHSPSISQGLSSLLRATLVFQLIPLPSERCWTATEPTRDPRRWQDGTPYSKQGGEESEQKRDGTVAGTAEQDAHTQAVRQGPLFATAHIQ